MHEVGFVQKKGTIIQPNL